MKHINEEFIGEVKTAINVYVMVRLTGHEKHAVPITKAEAIRIANSFTDEDDPLNWEWFGSLNAKNIYIG